MKRPGYEDLCNVRAALQVDARSMPVDEPFRVSIERVLPWLALEAERALKRECARERVGCPLGGHRVRRVEQRYADMLVEVCRCGAERVRDPHTREVSDWAHVTPAPLPSTPGSSSTR